jgi:amidophosphoribosyltransferase
MCGFVGIMGEENAVNLLYEGMISIQHRGQDAAGIATFRNRFHIKKGFGLVRDVFNEKNIRRLRGSMGIGHVRYPTLGFGTEEDAQPFYTNSPFGICMAHNGNVTNYFELKEKLFRTDHRHLNSECDVEVILNVFANHLSHRSGLSVNEVDIFGAVEGVFREVKGSFSAVSILADIGLVAFRDPFGIKPMVMGERKTEGVPGGKSYAVASESVVLDVLDYHRTTNIAPGEAVFVDLEGRLHRKQIVVKTHRPCIFEYVYFARPDSFLDRISVNKTRKRLGEELARAWKKTGLTPDVIIPVPDSARTAALAMATELGIKYAEGLVKNRYIGRTFIMPGQEQRKRSVKRKLNSIQVDFRDRKVLLVDDSIVRGNTSQEIVQMARRAGAKEVYFASYSPPLRYPCVYGIDMSTRGEFIAQKHSVEEICRIIGADFLLYQSLDGLIRAARAGNSKIEGFCTACFTGDYPTGDVSSAVLARFEETRNAAERSRPETVKEDGIHGGGSI